MTTVVITFVLIAAIIYFARRKAVSAEQKQFRRPILSLTADSRLRGLESLREQALSQLDDAARARWEPRLDEIVSQSSKLLTMLDANRQPSPQRDAAVKQLDELQDVMEEIAASPLKSRDADALDNRLIELKALAETLKNRG